MHIVRGNKLSLRNLARKGPRKVWDEGYRNLRVPTAIFDDVKRYLQLRKQQYLAQREGIEFDKSVAGIEMDEYSSALGKNVQNQLPSVLKQVIQEEFERFSQSVFINSRPDIPARKRTAKDRVREFLIQSSGEEFSTIQIGHLLDIPGPTARQVTRELSYEDEKITQFSGRPNRYRYDED